MKRSNSVLLIQHNSITSIKSDRLKTLGSQFERVSPIYTPRHSPSNIDQCVFSLLEYEQNKKAQ